MQLLLARSGMQVRDASSSEGNGEQWGQGQEKGQTEVKSEHLDQIGLNYIKFD